jgi:hypothetical protein
VTQIGSNYAVSATAWDTVIVLKAAGRWWWNAWREQTATELSGTAGTLGEARTAMERAVAALGDGARSAGAAGRL